MLEMSDILSEGTGGLGWGVFLHGPLRPLVGHPLLASGMGWRDHH